MNTRTAAFALLMLAPVSGALGVDTSVDAAKAQGREDSTNPMYQDGYLGEMRPAFAPVFQVSLNRCASQARRDELTSLGLVFAVKADGSVGDFFTSNDSSFARCLENTIREHTYPPAPKDEFYFGLDFAPQTADM